MIANTHAFTATKKMKMTKLPSPEQGRHKLNDREVAEERAAHQSQVDDNGRSVHLLMEFVRHYTTRYDSPLMTVVAIR